MKPVKLVPKVLQWVRERAGLGISILAQRMKVTAKQVQEWEQTGELSISKAKKLASVARTPFGYLFLAEPLSDALPIPDFRTLTDDSALRPSPDLLETIHIMQQRQAWMREYLAEIGTLKNSFIASAHSQDDPVVVAKAMRNILGITSDWANAQSTWEDALRHLREKIEQAGILIFINGVVGNNTHRKLDTNEFRGFSLSDPFAPLIFINGADAKSAQMFTIAHELAHLWFGQNGVSNTNAKEFPERPEERQCNAVAAEFLIPADALRVTWQDLKLSAEPFQIVARRFKVSPIVAARRCLDLNLIDKAAFFDFYNAYSAQEYSRKKPKKPGGDFWKTQNVRIGVKFGTAVVIAAMEGRLLYRDAYRLTGLNGATFEKYSKSIGLPII
jgi:Zn-dependent peptidase ImmA (M78 family)